MAHKSTSASCRYRKDELERLPTEDGPFWMIPGAFFVGGEPVKKDRGNYRRCHHFLPSSSSIRVLILNISVSVSCRRSFSKLAISSARA